MALTEVLVRFYGAALPDGWRLADLRLPGDGRFELDLDAAGTPLFLTGALIGHDGVAQIQVQGIGPEGSEPTLLSVALPPGVVELELQPGVAIVNGR